MKHINGYSAMSLGPSFFPDQKPKERKNVHRYFKDPGSAITHLIAMILSFIAGIALLIEAQKSTQPHAFLSMLIFTLSMVALYGASTCYHTFDTTKRANRIRKKIDHMMIFVLIAGSYTPICLLVLSGMTSTLMLIAVWSIAFLGCILKLFWTYCPKWVSSILYIAMGWTCIFAFSQLLHALTIAQFAWLLAGGIIYTIGGIIYALKLPLFNTTHPNFGSHEIFHLFVMGGSFCHFVVMFLLV